jgi:hypothetical protein
MVDKKDPGARPRLRGRSEAGSQYPSSTTFSSGSPAT